MFRTATLTAFALALASGGTALAQQAAGAAASGGTTADSHVGAPASDETGVRGVYSLKSMMGLGGGSDDTAGDASADASAKGDVGTGSEGTAEN